MDPGQRKRLFWQGTCLVFAPMVAGTAATLPDWGKGSKAEPWIVLAVLVGILASVLIGVIRLNRSRDGQLKDAWAILAVLLSIPGWLFLLFLTTAIPLVIFSRILYPGQKLFGGS